MRLLLVLISIVVIVLPNDTYSGVRFADVGFEVGAMAGDIYPTDFNEIITVADVDAVTWIYGFGAAAVLPLGGRVRASIGSGYLRSGGGKGTVTIVQMPSSMMAPTPVQYLVESVPLTGSVEFVFANSPTALSLGAALEVHYVRVTRRIQEQPALDFGGVEHNESAGIPGVSLTIGVERVINQRIIVGIRGGYRFAEGDIPFFLYPVDYRLDLSGGFAALHIRVHPWPRATEDQGP